MKFSGKSRVIDLYSGAFQIVKKRDTAFSPSSLGSKLKLWLDASQLSLDDSDPAPSCPDLSGNGHVATEETNPPIFKTNIQNGLPMLSFNGTSQFLSIPHSAVFNQIPLSIFSIVKIDDMGAWKAILSKYDGVGWSLQSNGEKLIFYFIVDGDNKAICPGFTSSLVVSTNTAKLAYGLINSDGLTVSLNGTENESYLWTGTPGNCANTGPILIMSTAPTIFTKGYVGEVVITSGETETERGNIRDYLTEKWGIDLG